MKILKLIIKDFQQFKHLELDFTHPETGEPLDRICFIGRNATGKSTILWIIWNFLQKTNNFVREGLMTFKFLSDGKSYYCVFNNEFNLWFSSNIEELNNWQDLLKDKTTFSLLYQKKNSLLREVVNLRKYLLKDKLSVINHSQLTNSFDLLIYCPPESYENNYLFDGVPITNLNEALNQFNSPTFNHIVSQSTITNFWQLLIFQTQIREKELKKFVKINETKPYIQIENEFNSQNPYIINQLAEVWNKILDKAHLYFDIENIELPNSLTENLEAYVKSKINNERIPYNKLSTGIRNFIFKIGHIYSLYFNRKIERGFLLVDEPENSLFPDFVYDLIDDVYGKILENQNTQFFVSTHNPIIATQFEPYERIILDFDAEGFVYAKKGKAPVGDDPNDILEEDFQIRNLMTQKGVAKYKEYQLLRKQLRKTTDKEVKKELLAKISKIGNDYNLPE